MAFAAVPAYLGQDFSAASPGLRFGMYLPLWGVDQRTQEKTWETKDHVYERRGHDRNERRVGRENKRASLDRALELGPHEATLQALARRQAGLASALAGSGGFLTLEAVAVAPFTTGLGNEHSLENGFAFLNPYGLPYLPGSGVKGVLRQAARELASGAWGDTKGWDASAIEHLFGFEPQDGGSNRWRGALMFWDVLPQLKGGRLQVDVMTPHQAHYYQGGESPHDSGQPNPICFLVVPPGSGFTFHVQCDVPYLRRRNAALAEGGRWQSLLQAAFDHAFAWLGFGAKTAVGYGAMAEDEAARQRREQAAAERARAAAAAAEAARKAAMSAEDVAWEEAQAEVAAFRAAWEKAKAAGPFNPGGPFNEQRLQFMRKALAWTEPRSRAAAGQALADSATKAWGRPSNKDTWAKLQAAIHELLGKS